MTTTATKRKPAKRRAAPKPAGFTFPRRAKFLAHVANNQGCSIKEAAQHAGVKRHQVKALLAEDEEFATDYREARGYVLERVRDELLHIALDRGNPSQLRAISTILKAYDPDFREKLEHSTSDGTPLLERPTIDLGKLTTPELEQLLGFVRKATADELERQAADSQNGRRLRAV